MYMQAHRDNERIAFQDDAFATHLWQMSGLAEVFEQMDISGQTAVGLNPNIRLYRQVSLSAHIPANCLQLCPVLPV